MDHHREEKKGPTCWLALADVLQDRRLVLVLDAASICRTGAYPGISSSEEGFLEGNQANRAYGSKPFRPVFQKLLLIGGMLVLVHKRFHLFPVNPHSCFCNAIQQPAVSDHLETYHPLL